MNIAALRAGNNPLLERVLSYDPRLFKDHEAMLRYLQDEHVSGQPEAHLLGYNSLVDKVSSIIDNNGIVFLTHGNTSSEDAAKKEFANIALLVESVYEQLKAQASLGNRVMLNIGLDLVPTYCQRNLDRYLKGEIKLQEFLRGLLKECHEEGNEYREKAMFASGLLEIAKRYGIEVIALDSDPDPRDLSGLKDSEACKDAKTYNMAKLLPPKTIVVAYEDLVRNSGILPVKVKRRYRGHDKEILRISQNPSQGIASAAEQAELHDCVINLTYLDNRPVDYLILGDVKKMNTDALSPSNMVIIARSGELARLARSKNPFGPITAAEVAARASSLGLFPTSEAYDAALDAEVQRGFPYQLKAEDIANLATQEQRYSTQAELDAALDRIVALAYPYQMTAELIAQMSSSSFRFKTEEELRAAVEAAVSAQYPHTLLKLAPETYSRNEVLYLLAAAKHAGQRAGSNQAWKKIRRAWETILKPQIVAAIETKFPGHTLEYDPATKVYAVVQK